MAEKTVLALVQGSLKAAGVGSILVGGFAVIHHGYQRTTQDLDLMIADEDLQKAKIALERGGFEMVAQSAVCAKFNKVGSGLEAVDLVLVSRDTFLKVQQSGHAIAISGENFIVPTLDNLIAMKFHAIKQDPKGRMMKDLSDIAHLIKANKLDPRSQTIRDMCLKFGNQDIYDKLLMLMEP